MASTANAAIAPATAAIGPTWKSDDAWHILFYNRRGIIYREIVGHEGQLE
jgi:hypothetical protein